MKLIQKSGESVMDMAAEILKTDDEKTKPAIVNGELITLNQLKEKIQNLFAARIKDKCLVVEIKLSIETADMPFPKAKLQQIIGNLLSNAIKFTPSGGKVTLFLELLLKDEQNLLYITISDTGVGMENEMIAQILNSSTKSTSGTNGEAGFGLGLALVKQLVTECKGNLTLSSQIDLGTTFKVSIPLLPNINL